MDWHCDNIYIEMGDMQMNHTNMCAFIVRIPNSLRSQNSHWLFDIAMSFRCMAIKLLLLCFLGEKVSGRCVVRSSSSSSSSFDRIAHFSISFHSNAIRNSLSITFLRFV